MKKFVLFVIGLFSLITLIGCDNEDNVTKVRQNGLEISEDTEITQELAWEIVKRRVLNNQLEEIDVYVSENPVQPNTTIETYSTPEQSPNYTSWLFFIDYIPYGNWSHPCKYVYVNVVGGKFETHEHSMPPIMYQLNYIPLVQMPPEQWDESKYDIPSY